MDVSFHVFLSKSSRVFTTDVEFVLAEVALEPG